MLWLLQFWTLQRFFEVLSIGTLEHSTGASSIWHTIHIITYITWSCRTAHLTPHTSHFTPHTSHLTPHTSYITHHTSDTTHHTPHTTHHTPYTTHHTPSSHTPHHILHITHQTRNTKHQAPNTKQQTPNITHIHTHTHTHTHTSIPHFEIYMTFRVRRRVRVHINVRVRIFECELYLDKLHHDRIIRYSHSYLLTFPRLITKKVIIIKKKGYIRTSRQSVWLHIRRQIYVKYITRYSVWSLFPDINLGKNEPFCGPYAPRSYEEVYLMPVI